MKDEGRKTFSIVEAREAVGVSRRTIYNWISAGMVEYERTAAGILRIFADSLWHNPEGVSREGRPTLSINKACGAVGVCRGTMLNWINNGKVRYIRTAGGSIRIFTDSLWRSGGPCQPSTRAITES